MNVVKKKNVETGKNDISQDENVKNENSEILLEVRDLVTYFYTEEGVVKAVDGVSFDIFKDEVLGLVGETGCGKSVTALSILQLVRAPGKIIGGDITYNKKKLLKLKEKDMRAIRGKDITMIFQDPLNSLNPVISVGKQISEVLKLHQSDEMKKIRDIQRLERRNKVKEKVELKKKLNETKDQLTEEEIAEISQKINTLKKETIHVPGFKDVLLQEAANIIREVGIADAKGILKRYPHELSGGMRQRVMIAMALSCNPGLLIADEPTTALDVTIQAQILQLIKNLKDKYHTSMLLITHDLGIIAETCDRVAVMYSGNIVEYATATELFKNPRHPYTKGLISAIPSIEKRDQKLETIRGMVPNLIYPPSGCRFHPRCDERLEVCHKIKPKYNEIDKNYFVACHLFDPEYKDSKKYQRDEEEELESHKI